MPVALSYTETGPSAAPPVLLGPALGSTRMLWDELVEALAADHCVIALDLRGHGQSPDAEAGVTVADLAADVIALADQLVFDTFSYVGISLGGAVGQQIALARPGRLSALVLACTAPRFGAPADWHQRAAAVRAQGMAPLREPTSERWFADDVRDSGRARSILTGLVQADPASYAACCGALADFDTTAELGRIETSTLVVSGELDQTAPPEVGSAMARAIPEAEQVVIRGAAHLANVARPREFNSAVVEHLAV